MKSIENNVESKPASLLSTEYYAPYMRYVEMLTESIPYYLQYYNEIEEKLLKAAANKVYSPESWSYVIGEGFPLTTISSSIIEPDELMPLNYLKILAHLRKILNENKVCVYALVCANKRRKEVYDILCSITDEEVELFTQYKEFDLQKVFDHIDYIAERYGITPIIGKTEDAVMYHISMSIDEIVYYTIKFHRANIKLSFEDVLLTYCSLDKDNVTVSKFITFCMDILKRREYSIQSIIEQVNSIGIETPYIRELAYDMVIKDKIDIKVIERWKDKIEIFREHPQLASNYIDCYDYASFDLDDNDLHVIRQVIDSCKDIFLILEMNKEHPIYVDFVKKKAKLSYFFVFGALKKQYDSFNITEPNMKYIIAVSPFNTLVNYACGEGEYEYKEVLAKEDRLIDLTHLHFVFAPVNLHTTKINQLISYVRLFELLRNSNDNKYATAINLIKKVSITISKDNLDNFVDVIGDDILPTLHINSNVIIILLNAYLKEYYRFRRNNFNIFNIASNIRHIPLLVKDNLHEVFNFIEKNVYGISKINNLFLRRDVLEVFALNRVYISVEKYLDIINNRELTNEEVIALISIKELSNEDKLYKE